MSTSKTPKTTYAKRFKALQEISKTIVSDLYLDDILRLIVTVTAEVMSSKICSLWLLGEDGKELKLCATQTIDEEYIKERSLRLGEGIVGIVAENKKPMIIPNVLDETKYKEKNLAKKLGLCSMLSIPMEVKGRVIGVINSYTSVPHQFTKAEIGTLTTVANQAAIVIENTHLMMKTKIIQEELQTRKLVERAKGILMRESGVTEDEAYRRIQKKSMDSRKSMREVADAIILSCELRK